MGKRNIGERAESYFDSIDLQILELLTTAQNERNNPEGYSVLDIADKLKVKHNSLKPHIDKLINLNLVFAYSDENKKLRLWTGIANMYYTWNNDFSSVANTLEEQKKYRKENEEQIAFIEYLKKVREIKRNENLKKQIDIDLRKSRSNLPQKKDYITATAVKKAKKK